MKYFRYRHTNCFFVQSSIDNKLLAIDAGWPCSLLEYQRGMKGIDLQFSAISWAIVTHFHMDHAGLVSDFLENDIRCFIINNQMSYIDDMERIIHKSYPGYNNIKKEKLVIIEEKESGEFFRSIGIDGQVIITDGHSPDSITFINEEHEAIIGDLPPIDQVMPDDEKCTTSWEKIRTYGVIRAYPSHANLFNI